MAAPSAPNSNQALFQEQTSMLLKTQPLMLSAELLAACIMSWIYASNFDNGPVMLIWLVVTALLIIYRFQLTFHYRRKLSVNRYSISLPAKRLFYSALTGGLLFAVAALILGPARQLPFYTDLPHLFFGAILVGLACIGTASYAADLKTANGYILLLLGPIGVIQAWQSLAAGNVTMSLLVPILIVALFIAARRMHASIMLSLRTELRNRSLIKYLDNARKDAEQLSDKLAREVFDRRSARQHLQEAKNRLESMVAERTKELQGANAELSATTQRLQLALDVSRISMWEWKPLAGTSYQARFKELFGIEADDKHRLAQQIVNMTHPDDLPMVRETLVRNFKGQANFYQATYRMRHGDGQWHWIEDHGQVVARNDKGWATHMIGTRRDVTDAKEAEEQRRLAATVFENASEAIFIFDPEFRFLAVNESFTRLTGYKESESVGYSLLEYDNAELQRSYRNVMDILREEGFWQGELIGYRKGGETFPEWAQVNAVYNDQHQLTHYVGMFYDLTERKNDEEQLQFLSNHDRLTGLSNRNQFNESLQRSLSIARLKRRKVALLYLDLDRFKPINDTLGHEIGDTVLKQSAERLLECGLNDTQLARIDSDEFTVLLPLEDDSGNQVEALSQRIIQALTRPFVIKNHEMLLGASIGVSLYPDTAKDSRTMISQADIAMHESKRMGGNTLQYYRSDMRSATIEQLALETSLRKALGRDEFIVYYQPKLDLSDGMIRGAEALIRWQHPTMGLLTPGTFIPLAEETGLITEIGEWVLNDACQQAAEWNRQGLPITTSVNLSAHQFRSTDILKLVKTALDRAQLPSRLLEAELTETLLMDDLDTNIEILEQLRELGVGLSLDDFGTGYSSLSYLKRFPIDELKIDRAFVMDMETNNDDAAIVQAIITMAHSLKLKVIAEGVETQPQLEMLRAMGCDMIQGYLISRPVPAAEMEVLLFQQRYRYNQT